MARRLFGAFRRVPAPPDPLARALADPRRYETQIDRLQLRHQASGRRDDPSGEDVAMASLVMHRRRVARLLATSVSQGRYRLHPAALRTIRVGGKDRIVFSYPLLDLVVHAVVADLLAERVEPTLSGALHSYRPGRSWWRGVSAFAAFVRAHSASRPDPRDRGLYVLRRDVESYTDSIPLAPGSALWPLVTEALGGEEVRTSPAWPLVEEVVRPRLLGDEGGLATRYRGVATGQPISVLCFNLYLRDLDHWLAAIPGAFAARYSDDLVVAHPDPAVIAQVDAELEARLAALDLRFNAKKRRDLYLTGAGRRSEALPAFAGTTTVTFLGMRIGMDGTVALGDRRVRALLREAERRARNTARALRRAPLDVRGRAVAATLDALLDPDEPVLIGGPAPILVHVVTDRRQLDWLDHALARIAASAATGDPGAAAFRQAPYRRIRADWGLRSLRRARDRGARTPEQRAAAATDPPASAAGRAWRSRRRLRRAPAPLPLATGRLDG
ncbi:MAG: reverse transcriptase domain-containing protein [Chloroflexota bacterium]